jgi:hypothetical protein
MQMNDLFQHIKCISEQLNGLMTSESSDSTGKVSMPKTSLECLKQSVTDTLRLFVSGTGYASGEHAVPDADFLEPTTPPLDMDGGSTCCEPGHGKHTEHSSRTDQTIHRTSGKYAVPDDGAVIDDTPSPNKRRRTAVAPSARKNSARVAERCLPDCLRNLEHPTIDEYTQVKISSFMAANIMVMNLQKLQPKAEVVAMISRGAVLLLHESLLMAPEIFDEASNITNGLMSLTAACFWILAKFGGVRALTPDASLISMTAGIQKAQLFAAEMMIMEALRWDIASPLRRHNHFDALVF